MKLQPATNRVYEASKLHLDNNKFKKDKNSSSSADKAKNVDRVDLSAGVSIEKINSFLKTSIGKQLDEMFSEAGVDLKDAAGMDWSPEATATRIFDTASGFLEIWREQHPEKTEEEIIDSFEKTIRGAVDQGYSEAIGLLSGADLDKESVTNVAGETISLVHSKFDDFFDQLREQLEQKAAEKESIGSNSEQE